MIVKAIICGFCPYGRSIHGGVGNIKDQATSTAYISLAPWLFFKGRFADILLWAEHFDFQFVRAMLLKISVVKNLSKYSPGWCCSVVEQ